MTLPGFYQHRLQEKKTLISEPVCPAYLLEQRSVQELVQLSCLLFFRYDSRRGTDILVLAAVESLGFW